MAYATLYDKKQDLLPLLIACFGLLCSIAWMLQNRGSKYWQEAWERKVEVVETDVLGAPLFSNREPLQRKGIWGAAEYSVSKLAIAVSELTAIIWLALIAKALPEMPWGTPRTNWAVLIIAFTVAYIIRLEWYGRTTRRTDRPA